MLSLKAARILSEGADSAAEHFDNPEHIQAVQIANVKELCQTHGLYNVIAKMVCNNNTVIFITLQHLKYAALLLLSDKLCK